MTLEVISRIHETKELRMLAESEVGDDYKLKATGNLSVKPEGY